MAEMSKYRIRPTAELMNGRSLLRLEPHGVDGHTFTAKRETIERALLPDHVKGLRAHGYEVDEVKPPKPKPKEKE
jgi:hypothetical protein